MNMLALQKDFKGISAVIPPGTEIYYFDYPVHENVGDMLIWHGTEDFFSRNNIKVKKRFSYHLVNYKLGKNQLIHIPKEVIIVCHGGGNFGDLYSDHQIMRKLLVKNYPNHRIIILPQTIFYKKEATLYEDFQLFKKHKDFHLFVRDKASYSLSSKFLNNVYLSQDMAHSLYPIKKFKSESLKTLYFLRNDKERLENAVTNSGVHTFDWEVLYNNFDSKLLKVFLKLHSSIKGTAILSNKFLATIWRIYTKHLIKKAVKLFSSYENIVTSRLHGYILARLMDKNVRLIDNSYGKNSRYYECWFEPIKGCKTTTKKSSRE